MMQLTLTLLALPLLTLAAITRIGCYASLPSSFSGGAAYQYQTSSYCAAQCSSHSYFALTKGSTCICGDDAPSSSDSTDTCTIGCFGFGTQTCGGSDSYEVYANNGVAASVDSSGTGKTTSTSSNDGLASSTGTKKDTSTTMTTSNGNSDQSSNIDSKTTSPVTQEISGTTIVMYSTIEATNSLDKVSTTASSSDSSTSGSNQVDSSTSVIAPAVGGAVGGIALITIVVVASIFWKRRQAKQQEDAELVDSAYFSAMKRDNTLSSHHQRQISNPFIDKPSDMVDQRLNPVMLGRRRISEGSLADEADYSRKILRVANPDDEN